MDTLPVPARSPRLEVAPRWVDRLLVGFVIYVIAGTAWMLSGLGGPGVIYYVGLFYKLPAELLAVVVSAATARRMSAGALRLAWRSLTIALTLYLIADCISPVFWLEGRDPFPSPTDILYLAFYLPFAAAALWLIRAAAVRVPWIQLSFDAAGNSCSLWVESRLKSMSSRILRDDLDCALRPPIGQRGHSRSETARGSPRGHPTPR